MPLSKKEIEYYQNAWMQRMTTTWDTVVGGLYNECERNRQQIDDQKRVIEQLEIERDAWRARTEGAGKVIAQLNDMLNDAEAEPKRALATELIKQLIEFHKSLGSCFQDLANMKLLDG